MTPVSARWIALACTAAAAGAQALAGPSIWRCGNSYSDMPCEGARAIEADAPPSAERRRQADEGTRRDMEAASRMQRERLRLEAEQSRRRAIVIGPPGREAAAGASAAAPTLPKPAKRKKSLQKPDAFVASYANPDADEKSRKKKKPKAAADGH